MGAGYEIPISLSGTTGWSLPNNFNAPTNFFFGPAEGLNLSGQGSDPNQSANPTATSSAALGGNATSGAPVYGAPGGGVPVQAAALGGGGGVPWLYIAAAAVGVWFLVRHRAA